MQVDESSYPETTGEKQHPFQSDLKNKKQMSAGKDAEASQGMQSSMLLMLIVGPHTGERI